MDRGASVYIEHQVYDDETGRRQARSRLIIVDRSTPLDPNDDGGDRCPVGRMDGLATIGLINGRDQEGLRPQRQAAEHERDPFGLTRCRWPHTPAAAAAEWHKSANVPAFATPEARLSARRPATRRMSERSTGVARGSRSCCQSLRHLGVRSSDKQNINNSTPPLGLRFNSFGTSLFATLSQYSQEFHPPTRAHTHT